MVKQLLCRFRHYLSRCFEWVIMWLKQHPWWTLIIIVVCVVSSWIIGYRSADDKLEFAFSYFGVNGYNKCHDTDGCFLLCSFIGCCIVSGILVWMITYVVQSIYEQRRINQQIELNREENGLVTYNDLQNHVCILGYGIFTIPFIHQVLRSTNSIIVLLTSIPIVHVREEVFAALDAQDRLRIRFLFGSITSAEQIERLNLSVCKEVYILGEKKLGRDIENLQCAKLITQSVGTSRQDNDGHINVLPMHVAIDTPAGYATIKRLNLPNDYNHCGDKIVTDLRPFNFYENWARMLWGYYVARDENNNALYDRLDFMPLLPDSKQYVHLVIAGFDAMGTALLLEALRICHFPNYNETTHQYKTRITVIDKQMDTLLPVFQSRYPYLNQITDVDIEFRHASLENADIRQDLALWAQDANQLLTIAISFYDEDESFAAALNLPDECFYTYQSHKDGQGYIEPKDTVRILVRQKTNSVISDMLKLETNNKYRHLHTFGTMDICMQSALFDDTAAQLVNGKYLHLNNMYDCTQSWLKLNEDMRFSNRYQIEMYTIYKDYDEAGISRELLYQMEHLRWCADRSIIGYRDAHQWNIKDTSSYKQHCLIIPYKDLPSAEKKKDVEVIENRKMIESKRKSSLCETEGQHQ